MACGIQRMRFSVRVLDPGLKAASAPLGPSGFQCDWRILVYLHLGQNFPGEGTPFLARQVKPKEFCGRVQPLGHTQLTHSRHFADLLVHRPSQGSPLTLLGVKLFQGFASPHAPFLPPVCLTYGRSNQRRRSQQKTHPHSDKNLFLSCQGSDPKSKAAQLCVSVALLTL